MPGRQQLSTEREDSETTGAEAATEEAAETEAPKERRWRFSIGRRAKDLEPHKDSADDGGEDDAKPASRAPVDEAGSSTKAQAPVEALADEAPTANTEPDVEAEESEETPTEERMPVPHRPAGRRLVIAGIAAGVLFVASAAFVGATVQPYLADRAAVETKLNVARTATSAITTLWTYTPDNLESLPDRSARFLGGDFAAAYRRYIDAIVAPNKQAQVTNTTQVVGVAVESLTPGEATAIVYTNSVATSPMTKNIPSLRYLSYRLTMHRHDAKWLITRMSTVTSLDLTPQV